MIDAVEFSVETNWDESIHEFFDNIYNPRDLIKDVLVEDEFESEHHSSENGCYCGI